MVAAPIGPAMYRSEPRPMGLPPCAPGSACLAHFLAELAHVMRELRLSLAEFGVPLAMRRVHFAPHLLAGVRYFTHGFGARPTGFSDGLARLRATFPAPVGEKRHRHQQCNHYQVLHRVSPIRIVMPESGRWCWRGGPGGSRRPPPPVPK